MPREGMVIGRAILQTTRIEKALQRASQAFTLRQPTYRLSSTLEGGDAPPYPTYIALNGVQKGALAVLSAIGAAINPKRADLVAALGETTGERAFKQMHERMLLFKSGRDILEQQPRITNAVLEAAAELPAGTFGRAYGNFMGRRKFLADERPPVRFLRDTKLAYVAQRARETHDLWHVLFACPTTVMGELALKAVEFVQTGLPMAALSVLGAQWRLNANERVFLNTVLLPWAFQAGSRCPDLMCLHYERHFQVPAFRSFCKAGARVSGVGRCLKQAAPVKRDIRDLQDDLQHLRRQWRIITAPKMPLKKDAE